MAKVGNEQESIWSTSWWRCPLELKVGHWQHWHARTSPGSLNLLAETSRQDTAYASTNQKASLWYFVFTCVTVEELGVLKALQCFMTNHNLPSLYCGKYKQSSRPAASTNLTAWCRWLVILIIMTLPSVWLLGLRSLICLRWVQIQILRWA